MKALEHLFGSRPARIGIILLWLILGGLGGSCARVARQAVQRAIARAAFKLVQPS